MIEFDENDPPEILKTKLNEANTFIENQKTECAVLVKKFHRTHKQLKLVCMELDSLKKVLHKYESESTIAQVPSNDDRISMQEKLIEEYKSYIGQIMKETGARYEDFTSYKSSNEAELRSKISQLEKELAEAIETKELLEYQAEQRHMQGDYDPRKLQVLHFAQNPFDNKAQKQADELSELRLENEKMRLRLKVIEEKRLKNKTMNITTSVNQMLEEHPDPRGEIEDLQEELKKSKLKYDRDFELFHNLSKDFRLFCYDCLGYKVDIKKPGVFHVASSSADDPKNDFLKIMKGDSGVYSIALTTPYAINIQKEINMYAVKYKSIPTLLANITMQNFQKVTLMPSYD